MMEVKADDLSQLRLLIGVHPPVISSTRPAPRPNVAAPGEEPQNRNPRSARRHRTSSELPAGQIPYQVYPATGSSVQKLSQESHLIVQVRADEAFIEEMAAKSNAYARCAAMKRVIHQTDYEDHFYVPLQYRIRDQLTPKKYKQFLEKKKEAIERMDNNPVPIRSNRELQRIPFISVSKRGLSDPTYKYVEHVEKERKLTNFLARSNAEAPLIRKGKTKDRTLDYGQYELERHTRFYYGQTEEAQKFGKKIFKHHNHSDVDRALDMFAGPMP
jgi:hypothetical protein